MGKTNSHNGRVEPPWDKIDKGIVREVRILWENGIETHEACEGTRGHSFSEPTVRFYGDASEGYRAFAIARQHGLKVFSLRRYWDVLDGELTGPHWEMIFTHPSGGGIHPTTAKGKTVFEWGRRKK